MQGLVMVYFSLTSTGKPDDGPERRETVGKARLEGRETERKARLEGRETERKAGPEGRETERKVQPETEGKPEVTGGRQTERGSFGIVERTDGQQAERLANFSETGRAVFGPHSRRLRSMAKPERSPVPGRTTNGIESPERVEASAKAPSGFLASGKASAQSPPAGRRRVRDREEQAHSR